MKKTILLLVMVFALSVNGNAQSFGSLFGKLKEKISSSQSESGNSTADILSGILGTVTGGKKLTVDNIYGTWNYDGTSCALESDEVLAEVGSKLVTVKVEEKINELLLKVGVKKGNASLVFEKDGTCSAVINGKTFAGTYVIGEDEKSILFTFMLGQINLNSKVELLADEMNITFDANKVLTIVKNLSAAVSQYSDSKQVPSSVASTLATIKTISTLLEGFNGMRLGLKVSR